ncbi:hypothetical protein [Actinomadura gamaensis]|uniref:Integral membrane protein n=1 Tax=Actinomadura gamaensis TaxID=1763541 RepID=A0ABV9TR74_9ACTN
MRRVLAVGFAPQALFLTCLLALLRAHSFTGHSEWRRVPPATALTAVELLATICATAGLLGLLLVPYQVRAVRVLEGYWDRWSLTARLADLLVARQHRRWRSLRAAASRTASGEAQSPGDLRRSADAARRLAALPAPDVLLPTALGNALRAGELSAGERYGLSTLASWPRIYPQLSRPLADAVSSARDMLDASVHLCYSLAACTALLTAGLYDEPRTWWLPALTVIATAVAYKGAVTSAQTYSGLMHVVYDLHRFDLARALHHPLPAREDEEEMFERLSEALKGTATRLPYDHGLRDANRDES